MKVRVEYLLFGLVGAVLLGLAFWSLAPERVPEPEAAAPEAVQAPAAPVAAAREAEPVATREVVPAAAAVQPDEPGATEPAIEKKDDPNAPFVPQHKTLEDRLTRAAEQQELETRWAKESVA
jgi:type IV secretory pathway VirB10-like protein